PHLKQIQEPGNRLVTITRDVTDPNFNLTGLQDENGKTRTFGYDMCWNKVTGDQWEPLNASFGLDLLSAVVNQVDRGLGSVYKITAAAAVPLKSPLTYLAQVKATVKDGLQHETGYKLDNRGRFLQLTRPDNSVETWTRDDAGSPLTDTDFR